MSRIGTNQILLLVCLFLVGGTGTYLTYFRQQSTLDRLDQEIEAQRERKKEINTLRTNLSDAQSRYQQARDRWRTRYKIVPETVSSTDIVGYLTDLTRTGFRRFDVMAVGPQEQNGYNEYTFRAEGRAPFRELYNFVWTVENSRPFYRIQDLQLSHHEERTTDENTGRTTLDVLVNFEMELDAIYGAAGGLGVPEETPGGQEIETLPVAQSTPRPPVPVEVLPDPSPELNPFYPVVFDNIPPNEHGRLNVEQAELLSIVGQTAIFSTGDGVARLQEGDPVYLGRITKIDASRGRVVARLDKGGIVETVERSLEAPSPLDRIREASDDEQNN